MNVGIQGYHHLNTSNVINKQSLDTKSTLNVSYLNTSNVINKPKNKKVDK